MREIRLCGRMVLWGAMLLLLSGGTENALAQAAEATPRPKWKLSSLWNRFAAGKASKNPREPGELFSLEVTPLDPSTPATSWSVTLKNESSKRLKLHKRDLPWEKFGSLKSMEFHGFSGKDKKRRLAQLPLPISDPAPVFDWRGKDITPGSELVVLRPGESLSGVVYPGFLCSDFDEVLAKDDVYVLWGYQMRLENDTSAGTQTGAVLFPKRNAKASRGAVSSAHATQNSHRRASGDVVGE